MKIIIRLVLGLLLVTVGLAIGLWYRVTIIPLDRPFFLSDNQVTIVATHVDWMCNCANFVETSSYMTNPITEPDDHDYFFIEAANSDRVVDRDYFIKNKHVRLTGQFYLDKGIPREYKLGHLEDKPEHARVFRVEKIEYLTD